MSEENTPPAGESTPDPNQNKFAEYERKLSNISTQVAESTRATQELLQQMQSIQESKTAPAPAPDARDDEDIESTFYNNINHAFSKSEEKAVKKMTEVLDQREAARAQREEQAFELRRAYEDIKSAFPQVDNDNDPFTIRANEILRQNGKGAEKNPALIRAAAYQAATEMGVQSRKSAMRQNDDFSMGAPSNQDRKSSKESDTEISDEQAFWMEALDLPATKENKEKVAKRAKRKNWNVYK